MLTPAGVPVPTREPAAAASTPVAYTSEPDLTGQDVGPYHVRRKLGAGEWGEVYEAEQTTMGRAVALKVLSVAHRADPEKVQRFVADASAKANVQHPLILSVYEAGEWNGAQFYAREFIPGETLAQRAARGEPLDEQIALRILRVVTESISYLKQKRFAYRAFDASSIYLGEDGQPRFANLAVAPGHAPTAEAIGEIQALGRLLTPLLPPGGATGGVLALLGRMQIAGPNGVPSWAAMLQQIKQLEPRVVPADAFKLNEQEEAAIRAVAEVKRRQKRSMIMATVGIFGLLWVVAGLVWWQLTRNREKSFESLIEIPAGDFISGDNQTASLPTFWIDQYEVTISQYARFITELEKNPSTEWDHPRQPKGKSHKPQRWDEIVSQARTHKTWEGAPLSLDCPVFGVDWWDACAYAKWKGRSLPSEQEWEKAARGSKGFLYPWGNDPDPKRVNSGADFNARDGSAKATVDGYNRWAPVDAVRGDKSPFGVIGMAGNVREWTASVEPNPELGRELPVIRGGSFADPDVKLTMRSNKLLEAQGDDRVGFRTATHTAPQK